MFIKVVELTETMYSDQTRKFTYLSRKGMGYIMIAYRTDENYNFSDPILNITESQMLKTYEKIIMLMKTAVLGTKNNVLDNEISKEYKAAIKENGATHELVPLGEHWRNLPDKAIQTFKNHFVWVLAGLHESFPMYLWCRLPPQADMQLNLQ